MNLYLVQHGQAADKAIDPDRPLTEFGAADACAIGEFLAGAHIEVHQVWHSGKTRARQTAERLAEALGVSSAVARRAGLDPLDDPALMTRELQETNSNVMIVGHLPYLSTLACLLLAGTPHAELIKFEQAGVVALERSEDDCWRLAWMVIPALLTRR